MNKRLFRYLLTASITAAVCLPLIAQTQNNPAPPTTPAASGPTTHPAVDPNEVVISVGDWKITASQFDALVGDLDAETKAKVLSQPQGRKRFAEEVVNTRLLAAEAIKRKLDESPRTQFIYQQLLANAIANDLAEQKGADEQYFNEHKADFDELKARHILIAVVGSGVPAAKLNDEQAKAKADDIKKRLDKGEDFAALAKANSDDTGSGLQGGSLGTMSRGMMVAPFEQAAFALKKGEISQPVKTQFGYHIIQVTDRTSVSFDVAHQQVWRHRLEALMEQLRIEAKPKINESAFDPARVAVAQTVEEYQPFDAHGVQFSMASDHIDFENGGVVSRAVGAVVKQFTIGHTDVELVSNRIDLEGGKLFFTTKKYGKIRVEVGANFDAKLWATPSQQKQLLELAH